MSLRKMSLIDMSNISKPANALVKKISNAIGGIAEPGQIRRIAKAKADAAIIAAEAKIRVTDLQKRAANRWLEEEAKRQKNIEDITAKALPQLKEGSDPNTVEDDWITNFFDKSRIVSDNDMQNLWSRVLAGEANAPGTYSKRTVNSLSDMDKQDAELFSRLCGFAWFLGDLVPLIFDTEAEIYLDQGITFNSLSHLDSIGLIQFMRVGDYARDGLPKEFAVLYYETPMYLEIPDGKESLDIGKARLTHIGQELAPICGSRPVDGFRDYVKENWKEYSPKDHFGATLD